jgi:hypothetical protein
LRFAERDFCIDNLLVQIHSIWWTGLAPREFESSFPGSLISTFLVRLAHPPTIGLLQGPRGGRFLIIEVPL